LRGIQNRSPLRLDSEAAAGRACSVKPNADLKLGVGVPLRGARSCGGHLTLGGPLTGRRAISRSL
jgi:hypothetical protein